MLQRELSPVKESSEKKWSGIGERKKADWRNLIFYTKAAGNVLSWKSESTQRGSECRQKEKQVKKASQNNKNQIVGTGLDLTEVLFLENKIK